jgi:hypothetical protein
MRISDPGRSSVAQPLVADGRGKQLGWVFQREFERPTFNHPSAPPLSSTVGQPQLLENTSEKDESHVPRGMHSRPFLDFPVHHGNHQSL